MREFISRSLAPKGASRRAMLSNAGALIAGSAGALALMAPHAIAAESDALPWFQPSAQTGAGIQAALDAARSAGGGYVFLPAGIYPQNSILKVYDNTHLVGAGRGATIVRPIANVASEPGHAASICFIAAERSSIRGLTVDLRTNNAQFLNGISLLPAGANYDGDVCVGCSVEDCEVLGWDTHQYLIWNMRAKNTIIAGNYLDGGVYGYIQDSAQTGIEIFGGYNVLVQGNKVSNVGSVGIYPSPSVGVPNTENVNIEICHNQITNCGIGIQAQSCYGSSSGVQRLENINIHHNQIHTCYNKGISLYGAQVQCMFRNVRITDNQIANTPIGMINDFQANIPRGNQVGIVWSGNQIDGGNGGGGGAFNLIYLRNALVERNMISNSNSGAAIFMFNCESVKFSGNICDTATRSAMILQLCDSCLFTGNSFLFYNIDAGCNGIVLEGVTNSVFTENSFKPAVESYCIQGGADSHDLTVTRNYLLYDPFYSSPFAVPGINPNQGLTAISQGATSASVLNKKIQTGMRVQVTQIAGNIITPFMLTISDGQLLIRIPNPGDGTQQFRWEIEA